MFIGPIDAVSTFVNMDNVPKKKKTSSSKGDTRKVVPVQKNNKTKTAPEKEKGGFDAKA